MGTESVVGTAVEPAPKPKPIFTRPYIDVVRKGGKRRGYVVVAPLGDDGEVGVGWSLCGLKDRFRGSTGIEMAMKRAHRWKDREYYMVRSNHAEAGSIDNFGDDPYVRVPVMMLDVIRGCAQNVRDRFISKSGGELKFPAWVRF